MEEFSLKPVILFFVVVILGVVFLGEIADNQVENTELVTRTNETVTMTAITATIINESVTLVGGSASVAQTAITSITFFGNASINTDNNLQVNLSDAVNITKDGTITSNNTFATGIHNISYTYIANGTAQVTPTSKVFTLTFFGNVTNHTGLASITLNPLSTNSFVLI